MHTPQLKATLVRAYYDTRDMIWPCLEHMHGLLTRQGPHVHGRRPGCRLGRIEPHSHRFVHAQHERITPLAPLDPVGHMRRALHRARQVLVRDR